MIKFFADDWEWWRPRLFTLCVYALSCAALCQSNSCNADEQADIKSSSGNCRPIDCWLAFYRWTVGFLKDEKWAIVFWTAIIAAIALAQFVMFYLQWRALRDTIESAEGSTKRQLRAYITPDAGRATYQAVDAQLGQLFFEGTPRIINTGSTPAHNLRWSGRAEIYAIPLPHGFAFPELPEPTAQGIMLGPHQEMFLRAVVDDLVAEDQIERIKAANGFALHVWFYVVYDDIFGERRTTHFSQLITWGSDGKGIRASYPAQHNYAD